ncbi:MAG: hypothetical protein LUD03_03790 [Firmicutes bacterium]|nr:hypothetical protein [Bacillota bacterium]
MMNGKILLKRAAAVMTVTAVVSSGAVFASDANGTKEILCSVGDSLTVGTYAESAAETQALIDSRPDVQHYSENWDRGLVAVSADSGTFISWRWLGTESLDVKYNVYKNGVKLNGEPLSLTNYTDINPTANAKYSVSAVVDGVEGEQCDEVSVWNDGYLEIDLDKPEDSVMANGEDGGEYSPGDASAADLDGDGEVEIILKWDATVRDASKTGYTSNCLIDAYKLDGTKLWRIDMGANIRSGPHDTQFIVGDFDNDGVSEMAVRTADGTVSGTGEVIGDADAEWYAENDGKNLTGPLYLTVFKGSDGSIIDTIDFFPQSTGTYSDGTTWDISSWGDDWGNRSERYLGGMGCFDGEHTSFVQARGYYARSCVAAYHLEDGKIVNDWTFDSAEYEDGSYSGQGYHSLAVADVDYDAKDEVVYGSMVIDDNGEPLYSTGMGHGDSLHVGDFVPDRPGLEVFSCQEWTGAEYGFYMRDARTGEVLYGLKTETDNGRACAADIDPAYDGAESWTAYGVLTAADGTVISTNYSMPANFAIYWDGDLGREIENGNSVYKWNSEEENLDAIFKAFDCHSVNAAKSNPSLQADILGDWREELIFPTDDLEHLRIFTTTETTSYRIPTLLSDDEYRNSVAWQNVCYNQTTNVGYNLSYTTESVPVPQIYTVDADGNEVRNPDLAQGSWDIDDLYFGDTIELVPGCATALVNGTKVRVDNTNAETSPYINEDDRTMVPLRFISEAYGADVDYDNETRKITIKYGDKTIKMTVGENSYTVEDELTAFGGSVDTKSEIKNDRTFVPVRLISEALDKNVDYADGVVYISDIDIDTSNAAELKDKITSTAVPDEIDYDKYLEDFSDESRGYRLIIATATGDDGSDASAVSDYDVETTYTVPAGGSLTLKSDYPWGPGVPAVILAFGDDEVHHFEIQYSGDGENWQIGQADRVSNGVKGEYNTYYFGTPPYTLYVKYVSKDSYDTVIAEMGELRVE